MSTGAGGVILLFLCAPIRHTVQRALAMVQILIASVDGVIMVSLLFVGDMTGEVPASIFQFDDGLEVIRARDPDEATQWLATRACPMPELVVVAESRGGQFSHAALAALRRQAPLVRVWRLLGSWCEGEARSGRPPAATVSTYWHLWRARLGREIETVRRGRLPSWALPLTATGDERILAQSDESIGLNRGGTIAICASSAPAAAALDDLCRAVGYQTLLISDDGRFHIAGVSAVLWDTTDRRLNDAAYVEELVGRATGAPVLAIVGFPRADDVELACRSGIAAVISKPFLAGDLLWHLDRIASKAG